MKLTMLEKGCCGVITENLVSDSIKTRLWDIGFICGSKVECVGKKSHHGPYAYLIKGSVFSLRHTEAKYISVNLL